MSMSTYGRMFGALLTVLVCIGGVACSVFGEDLDSNMAPMATLSDLISYAYRENPSIREAREAWRGRFWRIG
jgi:hypothetical protein